MKISLRHKLQALGLQQMHHLRLGTVAHLAAGPVLHCCRHHEGSVPGDDRSFAKDCSTCNPSLSQLVLHYTAVATKAGTAHALPRSASAVPKFLDETTAKATNMHAQTDPAATPKATRLPCRCTLVNHLQLAAAAKNCFQRLGLVAAHTRSLLPGLREQ